MGLRGLVFLPLPKLLWMHNNAASQLGLLLYRNSPRPAFGRPAIARLVAMSAANTNTNTNSSTSTNSKSDFEEAQQQPRPVSVHARPPRKVLVPKIDFCPSCGGATKQQIPDGEEMPRAVCTLCGNIHYQNPKMVVGCLVEHEDKVLLCKRNIEPSHGLWTLPAGYMELGESAAEGAARETWEEANAEVEVLSPFAQFDIPLIGQSYIIFRGRFKRLHFSPGPESLECSLFKLDEIPFEKLAFSSIFITLQLYAKDIKDGVMRIHYGVIEKRLGASPSDPQGFVLRDYMCSNSSGSSLSPV